jgi:hypothetical protein
MTIIVELNGGLGNQLFQYANARARSLEKGVDFLLDISAFDRSRIHNGFELNKIFKAEFPVAKSKNIAKMFGAPLSLKMHHLLSRTLFRGLQKRYIREPYFQHWPGINNIPTSCYLSGYWQSEKYFIEHTIQIRDDLQFPAFVGSENMRLEMQIKASSCAVSVHVRRGDYASNPTATSYHGLCPPSYYQSAFELFAQKGLKIDPFVFSDDIEWVKNNIRFEGLSPVFISHNFGSHSYEDMALMSICRHNIIANSSFSWWGAWLNGGNDKIVVAPKNWFSKPLNTNDLLPKSWIQL